MKKWVKQTLKKALAGTVMCCMLAGMTACSNNQQAADENTAGEADNGDDSSGGKITLKWALWDWDNVTYYQPILDGFMEKYPDINIEYINFGYNDYPTALATQLAGDNSIDLITIGDIPTYVNLTKIGHLENLNELVKQNNYDLGIYDGLNEELLIDDGLYALPFRSDFWVTYYNKDLFDAAGVDYPTNDMTFDEYMELAEKMTSGTGAEKIYGTHFHTWRSTVQLFGVLDGEHSIITTDYDFLKPYYESVLDAQQKEIVMDYGSLKANNTHYSGIFYNNQLAMVHMGTWWAPTIIEKLNTGEAQCENWGIVKFPHPEGVEAGTTIGTVTSLGINSQSKNKDAAWKFISFMAGIDGAKIIADSGSFPAAKNDEVIDIISGKEGFPQDENSKEALNTVHSYLEMPISDVTAEAEEVLNQAHDDIMTRNTGIDEGIKRLDEEMRALLE